MRFYVYQLRSFSIIEFPKRAMCMRKILSFSASLQPELQVTVHHPRPERYAGRQHESLALFLLGRVEWNKAVSFVKIDCPRIVERVHKDETTARLIAAVCQPCFQVLYRL